MSPSEAQSKALDRALMLATVVSLPDPSCPECAAQYTACHRHASWSPGPYLASVLQLPQPGLATWSQICMAVERLARGDSQILLSNVRARLISSLNLETSSSWEHLCEVVERLVEASESSFKPLFKLHQRVCWTRLPGSQFVILAISEGMAVLGLIHHLPGLGVVSIGKVSVEELAPEVRPLDMLIDFARDAFGNPVER